MACFQSISNEKPPLNTHWKLFSLETSLVFHRQHTWKVAAQHNLHKNYPTPWWPSSTGLLKEGLAGRGPFTAWLLASQQKSVRPNRLEKRKSFKLTESPKQLSVGKQRHGSWDQRETEDGGKWVIQKKQTNLPCRAPLWLCVPHRQQQSTAQPKASGA